MKTVGVVMYIQVDAQDSSREAVEKAITKVLIEHLINGVPIFDVDEPGFLEITSIEELDA